MTRKLKCIYAAPIEKIGKFSLGTVGSLSHGSPYAIVTLKGERVGWVSFKTKQMYCYKPEHSDFEEAKDLVENWFSNIPNFNRAAKAWNDMNLGVQVSYL
jgi:hypothetical protein